MAINKSSKKEKAPNQKRLGVIYARYSSHAQREASIEQQIQWCASRAEDLGIEVVKIYKDKAVSGKSDRRPDFQRMMRESEGRSFQYVIAWKSDRIGRNMLQAMTNEARLNDHGVKVMYVEETFDDSASGRFALRNMMNVNQFYSESMAENIRRGMAYNAQNCLVNGVLPYGYKKGKDNRYEVVPEQADVVRDVFKKYLDDIPISEIARSLNSRGIKTRLGREWGKSSFAAMLKNDAYIGTYRNSGFVFEDSIPLIVPKEVFYAVQKKLAIKKAVNSRRNEFGEYMLTGKLFCGECGAYMTGISGKSVTTKHYYYYQCKNHADCKKKNIRREYIEELVAKLTQEYILNDEVIGWIADNAISVQAKARRSSDTSSIEAAIAEDKRAVKNIMNAIEQGIFTETTKERLLELEAEIKELETTLLLIKEAEKPIERDRLIFSLERLRDGNVEDKEYQRLLIDTFVKSVYIWDDRIEIDYYYTDGEHKIKRSLKKEKTGPKDKVSLSSCIVHHKIPGTFMFRGFLLCLFRDKNPTVQLGERRIIENF